MRMFDPTDGTRRRFIWIPTIAICAVSAVAYVSIVILPFSDPHRDIIDAGGIITALPELQSYEIDFTEADTESVIAAIGEWRGQDVDSLRIRGDQLELLRMAQFDDLLALQIVGDIESSWGDHIMGRSTHMSVSDSTISTQTLRGLTAVRGCESLTLERCRIVIIPDAPTRLRVDDLRLIDCSFDDVASETASELFEVKRISLEDFVDLSAILPHLGEKARVQSLSLSNISALDLEQALAKMPLIRRVSIENSNVDRSGIDYGEMRLLEALELRHVQLDEQLLVDLISSAKQLAWLHLTDVPVSGPVMEAMEVEAPEINIMLDRTQVEFQDLETVIDRWCLDSEPGDRICIGWEDGAVLELATRFSRFVESNGRLRQKVSFQKSVPPRP